MDKMNCVEVMRIDSDIQHMDRLSAVYKAKIDEIAKNKAAALARKNDMIQAGFCSPVVTDKIDPVNGVVIGKTYQHAASCKHKGDKLEVLK